MPVFRHPFVNRLHTPSGHITDFTGVFLQKRHDLWVGRGLRDLDASWRCNGRRVDLVINVKQGIQRW